MESNLASASTSSEVDAQSTHELVEHTIVPSGLARRSVAYILDCLIFLASMAIYAGTALYTPLPTLLGPWEYVLIVLPSYFVFSEGFKGKTLGKHALGLAVVKTDGTPIDLGTSLVRNFLRLIDGLPFAAIASPYPVGVISLLASPLNQRVGDRVAKTVVTYKPNDSVIAAAKTNRSVDRQAPTYSDSSRPQDPMAQPPTSSISMFKLTWNRAIEEVQRTDRRTAALLRDAYPSEVNGALLTLRSPYDFHVAALNHDSRIRCIEEALFQITDSKIYCRIVSSSTEQNIGSYWQSNSGIEPGGRTLDLSAFPETTISSDPCIAPPVTTTFPDGEYSRVYKRAGDGRSRGGFPSPASNPSNEENVTSDESGHYDDHYDQPHYTYFKFDGEKWIYHYNPRRHDTVDNPLEYDDESDTDSWDYDVAEESAVYGDESHLSGGYLARSVSANYGGDMPYGMSSNYFRPANHIEPSIDDLDSADWDHWYSSYDRYE